MGLGLIFGAQLSSVRPERPPASGLPTFAQLRPLDLRTGRISGTSRTPRCFCNGFCLCILHFVFMWPSPPVECSSVQGFVLARGAESWQRPELWGARGADAHARSCSPALAHVEPCSALGKPGEPWEQPVRTNRGCLMPGDPQRKKKRSTLQLGKLRRGS